MTIAALKTLAQLNENQRILLLVAASILQLLPLLSLSYT